jgi:AmmeMemoRadiSam system protein A
MPPLNSSRLTSHLTGEERATLLRLARGAIEARCAGQPLESSERLASRQAAPPAGSLSPRLRTRAGVFVTLHRRGGLGEGQLRGCVGFVETTLPLDRAVIEAAAAAATEDPRFSPVRSEELPELEIEISVLSAPAPIGVDEIRVGVHGLIVSRGRARGLLLPQVAMEREWSAQRFVEETCRKAGLPLDAWRQGARLEAFEADVFGENSAAEPGR